MDETTILYRLNEENNMDSRHGYKFLKDNNIIDKNLMKISLFQGSVSENGLYKSLIMETFKKKLRFN